MAEDSAASVLPSNNRNDGSDQNNNLVGSPQPTPTNVLMGQIRDLDWEGARSRLLQFPLDAQYRPNVGPGRYLTPLHLAGFYRAPKDIVARLMEVYPEGIFMQDDGGLTPLHFFLMYLGEDETIQLAVRRGGARLLSLRSNCLGVPLQFACRRGCSTAVLRDILQAAPEMIHIPKDGGDSTISLLWQEFDSNPDNEDVFATLQRKDADLGLVRENTATAVLMEKLSLLLGAALGKTIEDTPESLLHDLLYCYGVLGTDLSPYISLVLLLYPEQARNVDSLGRLPLHVRVEAAALDTSEFHDLTCLPTPLKLLLSIYPAAALIPSDDGGRLALHLALGHGGGRRWLSGGVELLVKAAPDVLALLFSWRHRLRRMRMTPKRWKLFCNYYLRVRLW